MKPTKILIVDDHPLVIRGIVGLLEDDPHVQVIGSAASGAAAMQFLAQNQTDVVLLDINLPDQSGLEVCRQISDKHVHTHVIAVSNHSQPSYIKQISEFGGSGYLLKNTNRQELLQAIEMVMLGKEYFSHEVIRALREQKETTETIAITRREKEVLSLIADGHTNSAIATMLFLSPSTVDTHRKNLIEKLGVNNTAALIKKAVQLKLVD
ncbi:MAG: response regulator transcription factor [Chitinophagales bacterium]|jgi:DNA-binding NarL/FixJ family response regulator|nr:response regulator transcription factor [Chitinophagales bacterium]